MEFALLNRDSQLTMFKGYNLFPSLETTYDDPYFDEPDPYFSNEPINRVFATIAEDIPTYYYAPYFGELEDMVRDTVYLYLTKQATLDETLEALQAKGRSNQGSLRQLISLVGRVPLGAHTLSGDPPLLKPVW